MDFPLNKSNELKEQCNKNEKSPEIKLNEIDKFEYDQVEPAAAGLQNLTFESPNGNLEVIMQSPDVSTFRGGRGAFESNSLLEKGRQIC